MYVAVTSLAGKLLVKGRENWRRWALLVPDQRCLVTGGDDELCDHYLCVYWLT